MTNPRLHLVGLPHTTTTDDITVCAYTAKATKFLRMMKGWDIVLYWGDRNDAPCSELVTLHSEEERQEWYPGLTKENVATLGGQWNVGDLPWVVMNTRAIAELHMRLNPNDLILLAGGWASHPIADAFPSHTVCEYGVGYTGWFTKYVCFESHTWRHWCYGDKKVNDGRFYDTVIHNFFDVSEFPLVKKKDPYLAFVGRLIRRKGTALIGDIAARAGMPLYVAGPGAIEHEDGRFILCEDGTRIEGDVHYLGVLGVEGRADLMGRATALLAPTQYIEPFGGVAVEAQMCGTPAITTQWGAFTETVIPQFRFDTVPDALRCIQRATHANPKEIRQRAVSNWSLDNIRPHYEQWLQRLYGLKTGNDFYGQ